jgi:hypothetical protein
MFSKLLAGAGAAALMLVAAPATAGQMPCCANHQSAAAAAVEPSAIEVLMAMDPQWAPAPPVRQSSEVWFMRPVLVDGKILQGHYVIEHDNGRMARGEPCTHIYAFNDRTTPVVTFDCAHLERDRALQTTATLVTRGTMEVLTEFQFAGETEAHGVPVR